MKKFLLHFSAVACLATVVSCSKEDSAASIEPSKPAASPPSEAASQKSEPKTAEAQPSEQDRKGVMTEHLGDFGSDEPLERADLPTRGVINFSMEPKEKVFSLGAHWEQYNFPFKAKRWGRYRVKITYILKNSGLGVQVKLGEQRVKKQLKHTSGLVHEAYLGEVQISQPGDQLLTLYTPGGVGFTSFYLQEVSLIPTFESPIEEISATQDGSVELLAKHAVTWSEVMRYEPKSEKNCLGFWTDEKDFAEWEFEVEKAGTYAVNVHQGCGGGGGSQVNIHFEDTKLQFTVKETGGYQNWEMVDAGKIEITKPGRYRLMVKPESKSGAAVMDVQKIVLKPLS